MASAASRLLQVIVAMDSSRYEAGLRTVGEMGKGLIAQQAQMGSAVDAVTGKLDKHGKVGQQAFMGIRTEMLKAGQQLGLTSDVLDRMNETFSSVTESATRVGKITAGVGSGMMAFGALGFAAASKVQNAQADLKNAVVNTGHAWDDYSKQLEKVASSQAQFGVSTATATAALATLTTASHDPRQAMKDLTLAEDVAARGHMSVTEAATQIARVYAGNTRVLNQFGIGVHSLIDPQKEMTKATKDQASAAAAMTAAEQHLSDVTARVNQARADSEAKYQSAVQNADQKVTDATGKLADARRNLADVEAQIHQRMTLTVQDTYNLVDAQNSLADVNNAIASGDLTGQAAFMARRDAQERLTRVQDEQAAKKSVTPGEVHSLRLAHEGVAKATDAHATAVEKLGAVKSAGPAGLSLGMQQEEAAAERTYAKAKERVAAANTEMDKAKADLAAFPTKVAHMLSLLDGAVHGAAKNESNTWTGMLKHWVTSAQNTLASIGTKYSAIITTVGAGVTVGGQIIAQWMAYNNAKMILANAATNTALLAENAATDATLVAESAAAGEASSLALGPVAIAIGLIVLAVYELWKHWDTVWGWIKTAFHAAYDFIKKYAEYIGIALLAMSGPIGILIAAVIEIWKHWDTVWGAIRKSASALAGFFKSVFGGIVDVLMAPVQAMRWALNELISFIDSIHISAHLPSWLGGAGFDLKFHIPQIPPIPIPKFDMGGVVGGPLGSPQLILAHAGETVLPTHRSPMMGTTVHLHLDNAVIADQRSLDMLASRVQDALLRKQRNGSLGFT